MNEELLKIAQEEFQRQYDNWTSMEPNRDEFYETIKKLEKLLKKYLDSKKTDKEKGSGGRND